MVEVKPIAHCHDGIAKVFMFTALLLGLIVGDSCSRVSSNSSLSNHCPWHPIEPII